MDTEEGGIKLISRSSCSLQIFAGQMPGQTVDGTVLRFLQQTPTLTSVTLVGDDIDDEVIVGLNPTASFGTPSLPNLVALSIFGTLSIGLFTDMVRTRFRSNRTTAYKTSFPDVSAVAPTVPRVSRGFGISGGIGYGITSSTIGVVILLEFCKMSTEHDTIPGDRSHKTLANCDWPAIQLDLRLTKGLSCTVALIALETAGEMGQAGKLARGFGRISHYNIPCNTNGYSLKQSEWANGG
ncbi:hypothetical protein C8J57DRAFT_1247015 [Mycena rebaudengoi]|nr:hypothetical protein C8J57DRAFT_1247015 [Mycena rebaudengoi]